MTHLSPAMRAVEPYPFEELDRRKADAVDAGRRVIDFGVGDPREETPAFVREALEGGDRPDLVVPARRGAARAAAARSRLGSSGASVPRSDPDTQILPTLGFEGARVLAGAGRARSRRRARISCSTTAPGYPIPERGARFAGGEVARLRLTEERGVPARSRRDRRRAVGARRVLWLNYPNNPTGAVAPLAFLAEAAERCRAHDVLLASDEAYSELWFGEEPPPGALQVRRPDATCSSSTRSASARR